MNNYEGGTPFAEPMEKSLLDSEVLFELRSLPNKVVREEVLNSDNSLEAIRFYREARDAFYKMRDEFDVPVPQIDLVLGLNDQGKKRMFMAVDKIEGETIYNIKEIPIEKKELFDDFYYNVLRAMFDAYKKRQPVWWDFDNEQFVYGHKTGETTDKIYLTDVGPIAALNTRTFIYPGDNDYDYFFARTMGANILDQIKNTENKFSDKVVLTKTRALLQEIKNYIDQQEK